MGLLDYTAPATAGPAFAAQPAQKDLFQAPNPEALKSRLVAKYPSGVSSDGTPYAKMDAAELTKRVVEKYPDGVTKEGIPYKAYLPPEQPPAPNPNALTTDKGMLGNLAANVSKIPGQLGQIAQNIVQGTGMQKTADTLGTDISRLTNKNSRALNPAPSLGSQAGAAFNIGSMLMPVGAVERTAAPLLGKVLGPVATRVASKVAGGVAAGGAYDVGQNLDQGRNPLTPGIGTALGVAGPLVGEAAGAALRPLATKTGLLGEAPRVQQVVTNRQGELQKLEDSYATLRKASSKAQAKGIDVKTILSQTDLLRGAVDKTGTIRTQAAIKELNDFIRPQEDVITKNLQKEGTKVPLQMVQRTLTKTVMDSSLEGGALERALQNVETDMKGLARRADKDGFIPLATVHNAKVDKYANINYLNPESKKADKIIAKGLKDLVVARAKSIDVDALNKELAPHYAVQDFLEKLDGKKVAGGKLGRYFAQTLGGVVGSHFGPLGAVAGAELGGRLKGASMSATFKGRTGGILQRSDAMNAAVEKGKQTVIPMGSMNFPQENNLGSRNMAQSTTIANTSKDIPPILSQPAQKSKGFQSPGDYLLKAIKNQTSNAAKDIMKNGNRGFVKISNSKYLYHGTNEQVLDSISKNGLKPMRRGLLSLSKDEAYAQSFARQGMTPQGKTNPVLFRVKADLLKGKAVSSTKPRPAPDELHETLTKKAIRAESLEVYKNGKWQPLTDLYNQPNNK